MQRWRDMNKLRFITIECRLEAIEHKLEMAACSIIQSIEDQLDDDTDSRF